jgi:hypothetical protein
MSLLEISEKPVRGKQMAPEQRIRLTQSLVVALWQRRDAQGNPRLSWSLDSHNEADPHRPFRKCTEEQCIELGLFAQRLSLALAKRETLPISLRKRLAQFANAMAQVDELMRVKKVNGEAEVEDSDGKSLLSFE